MEQDLKKIKVIKWKDGYFTNGYETKLKKNEDEKMEGVTSQIDVEQDLKKMRVRRWKELLHK